MKESWFPKSSTKSKGFILVDSVFSLVDSVELYKGKSEVIFLLEVDALYGPEFPKSFPEVVIIGLHR